MSLTVDVHLRISDEKRSKNKRKAGVNASVAAANHRLSEHRRTEAFHPTVITRAAKRRMQAVENGGLYTRKNRMNLPPTFDPAFVTGELTRVGAAMNNPDDDFFRWFLTDYVTPKLDSNRMSFNIAGELAVSFARYITSLVKQDACSRNVARNRIGQLVVALSENDGKQTNDQIIVAIRSMLPTAPMHSSVAEIQAIPGLPMIDVCPGQAPFVLVQFLPHVTGDSFLIFTGVSRVGSKTNLHVDVDSCSSVVDYVVECEVGEDKRPVREEDGIEWNDDVQRAVQRVSRFLRNTPEELAEAAKKVAAINEWMPLALWHIVATYEPKFFTADLLSD